MTLRKLVPFATVSALSACELFSPPPASPLPAPVAAEPAPVVSSSPPPEPEPAPSEQAVESQSALAPGIEPERGQTRGRLPKAAINEGVQQAMPAIEACYLKGAQSKPGLRGRVLVNFVIAPDGSVPYAASLDQGTDFPDAAVIDCVLRAFQALHFPEPVGGRVVATYPLVLEPAQTPAKAE
jgi:outer membrane biosynthesis protein TonB